MRTAKNKSPVFALLGVLLFPLWVACGNGPGLPGNGPGLTDAPAEVVDENGDGVDDETNQPVTPEIPIDESSAFRFPALQTKIETYALTIPEAALEEFRTNTQTPERDAQFTYQGKTRDIKIRLRGGSSRDYPKKSWRIEFPEGEEKFQGRRKLNLVAEQADRTMMVEKLAYDLLLALRAPAPKTKFVRVVLNGHYEGLFLDIERVDKDFLDAHAFVDDDANIYRSGSKDSEMKLFEYPYQGHWEKKTNETQGRGDLDAFLKLVNRSHEADFRKGLERTMEVDRYLKAMVMDALMSNDIVMDSQSYLIRDKLEAKFTYVPWDLNNSAARWWPTYGVTADPYVQRPVPVYSLFDARVAMFYNQRKAGYPEGAYFPAFSNLTTRVFLDTSLRQRYLAYMERALSDLFDSEQTEKRLTAMYNLIRSHVEEDPYLYVTEAHVPDPDGLQKFRAGLPYLKKYVVGRGAFLRREIAKMRNRRPPFVISAVHPAEGWVEITNQSGAMATTASLRLTTDLRADFRGMPNMPFVTLADGGHLRIPAVGLSRAGGEVGLFDDGPGTGAVDALFYGSVGTGPYYREN